MFYLFPCFAFVTAMYNTQSSSNLRGSTHSAVVSQDHKADMYGSSLDESDDAPKDDMSLTHERWLEDSTSMEDKNVQQEDKLFEGDIIPDYNTILNSYGPDVAKELVSKGILEEPTGISPRNLRSNLWTTRVDDIVVVPYSISSEYTSQEKARINGALRSLGDRSKVIRFVPRTGQRDYVAVFSRDSCSSKIGRIGGKQDISLNRGSCMSEGTIEHEFLHAIGMYHEQARPDRDKYVKINTENIQPGFERNFKRAIGTKTLGNPYDYKSVMHYPKKAFSRNKRDTITALNGASISRSSRADEQDILDIRLMYQCTSGLRTLHQYNTQRCTSDCKCWMGEEGCNGNNNACQGSLVCSNNTCSNPGSRPTPSPPPPTPTPPPGSFSRKFVLINPQTGKALDVEGGRCDDGTNIHLWDRHDGDAQIFHYHYATKAIVNVKCDKAVDVFSGVCNNGANIGLWERNGSGAQQFQFYRDQTIHNVPCNKAIDIYQKDTANGTNIWLYDANNEWDKKWTFVYV